MNHRRKLLKAFGVWALASPFGVFAQQANLRRVGFLYFASRQSALETGRYELFLQGMRELGYVEGRNYELVARFADGVSERVPGMVEELARMKVDAIVATGTPVALPPGRLRLVTSPSLTGSPEPLNTIGIVEVAAFAATAGVMVPVATMSATLRFTRSVTSIGNRS